MVKISNTYFHNLHSNTSLTQFVDDSVLFFFNFSAHSKVQRESIFRLIFISVETEILGEFKSKRKQK